MATISSTIQLYDKVTAPINRILGALDNMVGMFESVGSSMDRGFDPSVIADTRREIDLAAQEMKELGGATRKTEEATDGLTSSITKMVGAYASFQGMQKLFNLSDTAVQTTARLSFIVDDKESEDAVANLEEKIMASAERSRASYQTTADAVAKLGMQAGKAFGNNDELIAFTELLNKSFVLAGTSAQGVDSVMLQMTQAMAAGKLQGEELNAILDNAQPIVANIQKYLEEVQNIDASNIKKLASEGVLTADVIKNAMFYASKDIEEDFKSMPMTWSQVWNGVMNDLYKFSQPVLKVISFLAQNWSILEPIVLGVTTAIGLYTAALLVAKGVQMASNIAKTIGTIASIAHGAAITAEMTATTGMTSAQLAFNAALYACPLTWILLIIIAIIAVVYAVVAAINKVTDSTISATGMIVGVLATAGAFLWNLILGAVDLVLGVVNLLWNRFAMFANFFSNFLNDPIASVIHLFGDMADSVLGILETIASAMDKVFGSNMAGAVQGWRSGLNSLVETAANKYGNGSYEKVVDELNMTSETFGLNRWAYGDAYNTGYGWGEGLGDSVADAFDTDSLLGNVATTAENTGKVADALDITNEDLKYLKDLAERDVINRFTTAEIKVDMTNHNNIGNNMDLDGIVEYLVIGVNEAMAVAAEGVSI